MSVELKKVVIGLHEDAYDALKVVADVEHDGELGAAGRILLTEKLLGKAHAIKVMAERFARAIKEGNNG
jgi:hypothetical protein